MYITYADMLKNARLMLNVSILFENQIKETHKSLSNIPNNLKENIFFYRHDI